MADKEPLRNVFILANPERVEVQQALDEIRAIAEGQSRVVGVECSLDGQVALRAGADRIIVVGGDGTLLGVGRTLGADQRPLIGVNFGKLGFLAEFTVDELREQFHPATYDDSLVEHRTILDVQVERAGRTTFRSLSINDCVIQAGPPYRLISLSVAIDGKHLTEISGDGLIVCTPSGSTAHNLSAGGPIVQAGVQAIVLTPLCAHSLTHRPMVIERNSIITVTAEAVNSGTTAIIDGQVQHTLEPGDRINISTHPSAFQVVHNPKHPKWHKLVTKLGWGRYRET